MTIVLERRGMKMIVRWKLIRANILQLQLAHGPHLTNIIQTPYSYKYTYSPDKGRKKHLNVDINGIVRWQRHHPHACEGHHQ